MDTIGNGTGQLNLKIQIGSIWTKNFIFKTFDSINGIYTDEDISLKTFSFFIKKNKGDRLKIFNLTNGNGITVPVYSTNEITVKITAVQTGMVEEGEYYWELRRTDLDNAKVAGLAYFTFDAQQ